MSAAPVDVGASLDACDAMYSLNLARSRRKFDGQVARGKEPHEDFGRRVERAEYLREHLRTTRDAVLELIKADREFDAAREALEEARYKGAKGSDGSMGFWHNFWRDETPRREAAMVAATQRRRAALARIAP